MSRAVEMMHRSILYDESACFAGRLRVCGSVSACTYGMAGWISEKKDGIDAI
jgi:hypothetical protein